MYSRCFPRQVLRLAAALRGPSPPSGDATGGARIEEKDDEVVTHLFRGTVPDFKVLEANKARVKGRLLQPKEGELRWLLLVGGQLEGGDVNEGEEGEGRGGRHYQVGRGQRGRHAF